MPIKLNTASGGGVILTGANTASDKTITVPAVDGTMVLTGVSGNVDINAAGSNYLTLSTNTTERARIDSSGNLLVNTTAQVSSGKFEVLRTDNGANVATIKASSTSFNNDILQLICSRSGATTEYNALTVFSNNTGTLNMLIRANGNLLNLNNSYGSLSDQRVKENIVDATPKLEKLNQVRVVNFNLKGEEQKQIGVVAQELEQIFPGMIEEDKDGMKGVKYSVFVPMLIKAIQEQQQMIETLQAKVAALEAK